MRRHVVTLSEEQLRVKVNQLQREIVDSGFYPDAVLSIRRGGEFVGELMFPDKPHYAVTLQRPGTKHKNSVLKKTMCLMPRYVLDRLRILESWWLSKQTHRVTPQFNLELPRLYGYRNILIVDDAADSGATLRSVFDAVKLQNPDYYTKTAVITVTTGNPLIQPDFAIYNNLTLIRFPWSIDS